MKQHYRKCNSFKFLFKRDFGGFTMITLSTLLFILWVHWLADYFSKLDYIISGNDIDYLFQHSLTYTIVVTLSISVMFGLISKLIFYFFIIILTLHFIVDLCSGLVSNYLVKANKENWILIDFGVCQTLHLSYIVCLFSFFRLCI